MFYKKKNDVNMALSYGDISTRTRQKLEKPGDKDVDSAAVNEIVMFLFPKLPFIFSRDK